MSLFGDVLIEKCPTPATPARRRAVVLADGRPRLVESTAARQRRADAAAWQTLLQSIAESADARVDLLRTRTDGGDVVCPWAKLTPCDATCRCGGAGAVSVQFLRRHYGTLATELAVFVASNPITARLRAEMAPEAGGPRATPVARPAKGSDQ